MPINGKTYFWNNPKEYVEKVILRKPILEDSNANFKYFRISGSIRESTSGSYLMILSWKKKKSVFNCTVVPSENSIVFEGANDGWKSMEVCELDRFVKKEYTPHKSYFEPKAYHLIRQFYFNQH